MSANTHFNLTNPKTFSFDFEEAHYNISSTKEGRNWKVTIEISQNGENTSNNFILNPIKNTLILGVVNPEYQRLNATIFDISNFCPKLKENIHKIGDQILFEAVQNGKTLSVGVKEDLKIKEKTPE